MKKLKQTLSVSIIASIVALIPNCALYTVRDLTGYPEQHRGVFVYNFTNETFQQDVNREMTEIVKIETSRRGNLIMKGEAEQAAIWISGEITMYRKEGRMYDNFRDPVRYELIIACAIRARTNPKFTGENFPLLDREFTSSVDFSDSEGFVEGDEAARSRLLGRLAREISSSIETAYVAHFGPSAPGK